MIACSWCSSTHLTLCRYISHLTCVDGPAHGESAQHAAVCGAGVGIFLLVKSTKILLIRGRRICLYPSVYLDAHGRVVQVDPRLTNS